MKIKRYLPIVLCLILVSCMLSSCTSPENTGTPDSGFSVEPVAYGSCKWGMTEEEVLQALSLSEDQVTDGGTDQSGGHAIQVEWDQPVFGEEISAFILYFESLEAYSDDPTLRLTGIQINYTEETSIEDIWDSVSQEYSQYPEFEIREKATEKSAVWVQSRETLYSSLTPSANQAILALYQSDPYTSYTEEGWQEELKGEPLVSVDFIPKPSTAGFTHRIMIRGYNQQIAEIMNQRFPET